MTKGGSYSRPYHRLRFILMPSSVESLSTAQLLQGLTRGVGVCRLGVKF